MRRAVTLKILGIVPVLCLAWIAIHSVWSSSVFARGAARAQSMSGKDDAAKTQQPPSPPGSSAISGLDIANLDPHAKACTNFFQYADGGWIARHPIPPQYSSWGTFVELEQHNERVLRGILERDGRAKASAGSNEQKLGDFYSSCMNTQAIASEGINPLEPELSRIGQIHDLPSLERETAHLQTIGVDVLFDFGSEQDAKNSTQEIGGADQGGLGLPNREYYTKQDAKSKQTRSQYVAHVTSMFELMGDPAAKAASEAQTVMQIETRLADASMTPVQLRDPNAVYHKMDLSQLRMLTPNFSWRNYFLEIGGPPIASVNVGQPDFFKAVSAELTNTPLSDWKIYLRWHLIHEAAPYLTKAFVDDNFNFYGRTLTGAKQLRPRWQRCVDAVDQGMGMALGEQYVQVAFPPSAKAHAQAMVNNLTSTLRSDLATLPWMGHNTRQYAIAKLQDLMKKIGYPSKWRNYSALHISRGPYVQNILHAESFEFERDLKKIGKPVDRTEWEMTPPTVNAYYDPNMNEIVFPAGILQPPFFNPTAPDAMNYGAMGAVIGHETTHGFDDEGSQFDAQGNLKNWWTPQDKAAFDRRAACIVHQFDSYLVLDHLHENGKLVEGESIADLGGLTIAYRAMEKSLEGKPREKVAGFTPEQLFFLGYAQIWAMNMRPEIERLQVMTDPHPVPLFRVNGPLSNMPAFAAAWHCQPGEAMVRPAKERCKIW
jgi:putative endopeptidase